jgi:lipopolysaccharide transport system ATP-binding protein
MSESAIVVENLSKRYLIGHQFAASGGYKYLALRDVIAREVRSFARKASDAFRGRQIIQGDAIEEFWALKNVSFEVKQGENLGIVGRNGAGKSTLLKILTRITEPTKGRVLMRGRVASLLEVGTGFHPELTGRENIFLNGAILGMTQREIRKKFDEIIAFAGLEKFLDTPVKQYSSGMYVRLAFAVAAHLESEVLLVDEVLAVGDAEFQKKCLVKMDEVSRGQGRTILFVSHNTEAILRLCSRGIFLESGCVRAVDEIKAVIPAYLQSQSSSERVIDLLSQTRPPHFTGAARLAKVCPSNANSGWSLPFGQQLSLNLSIDAQSSVSQVEVAIALCSTRGFEVATWTNRCSDIELPVRPGINTFKIEFRHLRLLPGHYFLGIALGCGQGFEDYFPEAVMFDVVSGPEAADINADIFRGALVPFVDVSILD